MSDITVELRSIIAEIKECRIEIERLEMERDALAKENERLKAEFSKPIYGPSVLGPLMDLQKDRDLWKAKAEKFENALINIKGLCNSYGPDHPMPESTYACGQEAVEALSAFSRETKDDNE